MNTISNTDKTIDSRDVIRRLIELEEERESLIEAINDAQEEHDNYDDSENPNEPENSILERIEKARRELKEWDEENSDEIRDLRELNEEGENNFRDWHDGVTLVHDSHFEEYAKEFAEDIGAISGEEKWPCNHIDWEAAADELKRDYTSIEFDGETYWGC